MRIVHTADWHLADTLGRLDRTRDLQQRVEQIAEICRIEQADVLLIAGDLFNDRASRSQLRAAVAHLVATFGEFMRDGGTILAITGNHDRDEFCGVLRDAFRLASPTLTRTGELAASGRLHLHTGPTHFRLQDRQGQEVQFVSMPFPTGPRYLRGDKQNYASQDERRRVLSEAVQSQLAAIQQRLDPQLPSVLSAHLTVDGALTSRLFRMTEREDLLFRQNLISGDFDYVALGHIHCAQTVGGHSHVRYAGSIDRLDQGERDDEKSVAVVDIDQRGLVGEPRLIPLPATPMYTIKIEDFAAEFPQFEECYPDAKNALVKYELMYEPGNDNLPEMQTKLTQFFPRWHDRKFTARHISPNPAEDWQGGRHDASPSAVVRDYFEQQVSEDDPHRDALIELVEELLLEEPS